MAKFSDLFLNPDGTLSASKTWFTIGNLAMTVAFLSHSLRNDLDWELLAAYGAIVAGNNVATRFLKAKYARRAD